MNVVLPIVFLLMSCVVSTTGCGTTEETATIPACSDVDWREHASLTGAPTFNAQQIAPGDPISIQVPVNALTRSVSFSIEPLEELPGVGSGGLEAETSGAGTVEIAADDTDLPAGVYVANEISLVGETGAHWANYSADRAAETTYRLYINGYGDDFDVCVTDISAPTFVIVDDRP